jgi:hypothetical protein
MLARRLVGTGQSALKSTRLVGVAEALQQVSARDYAGLCLSVLACRGGLTLLWSEMVP